MILFKMKENKRDNRESGINSCENKSAQKRQLEKLTEIEVQLQPKLGRLSVESVHWLPTI